MGNSNSKIAWEKYFSRTIKERGLRYFNSGSVEGLKRDRNSFFATVRGSFSYMVQIEISNNEVSRMKCNCPFARDGHACKHMAAVLYAIEDMDGFDEDEAAEEQTLKFVNPFTQNDPFDGLDDENLFFHIPQLVKELSFNKKVLSDAAILVEQNQVQMDHIEFRNIYIYGSGDQFCGIAIGTVFYKKRWQEVRVCFSREEIYKSDCGVQGCYNGFDTQYMYYTKTKPKPCAHQLALLILIAKYVKENNPGDATDRKAAHILNLLRGKGRQNIPAEEEKRAAVFLEPRVEYDYGNLKASFKIGTDKAYVVKNLSDLVDKVENGQKYPLGKTSFINFSENSFTENAKKYYEYISYFVKSEQSRKEQSQIDYNRYYDDANQIKGSIELYGDRIDRFFDLVNNQEVEFNDKSAGRRKATLSFGEKSIRLELFIQKMMFDQTFDGITIRGTLPDCIKGLQHRYLIEETTLYRIDEKSSKDLEPWFDIASGNDIFFQVGKKRLSEFYYSALPQLMEIADVRTVDEKQEKEIESYLPPEADFHFYLDAENDAITCQTKAIYGDQTFTLPVGQSDNPYELRDKRREQDVLEAVRSHFPFYDEENAYFTCEKDDDSVYQLLLNGVDDLCSYGEVHSTSRFKNLNIRKKPKLSVGVSVESDLLNLEVSSDDISNEELLEILNSYRKKKKYYRLKNGDFVSLEDESVELLSQLMESLHVSLKDFVKGKMHIPSYRALYLDKMLENGEGIYTDRDQHFKKLVKEFKTVNDSDFEVPASLQKIMRNYQVLGFKWLKTLAAYGFGGILADDMGLGKTLQMISMLLDAKENDSLGTALIVAPASLLYNWQEELMRFAPSLKVCVLAGNQENRRSEIANYENWDVMVTSYDLLKRDIEFYENKVFSYEILDEAQYIKNHTTAAAKAVKVISSKLRFALTGTPIENRLSELWSIFDYLMPGFLYSYENFRKDYETPIAKNKDKDVSARLQKMVSPFILRRLKSDVLKDLPDKLEEISYAKMDDTQQRLYDGQVVHMKEILNKQSEESFKKNKLQILAEITKLRQICCDPSLMMENYKGESAKRESCMTLIQRAISGEHKILLFSQFTSMLELLEEDLKKEGISYYKITGATSKEKRLELVKQFNKDDTPVFLISLKAGGTGLNLTGADVVIHYDPWWNLAVQNQATDRAHRIGQQNKVTVYKLITKGTIEEKIVALQETKKNLADEILTGENGGIGQLSRDEILGLIAN